MDRRPLCVFLLASLAAGSASADLVNGGFEASFSDGNSDVFPGWDAFDGRNISIVDTSSGFVHSGDYAARIGFNTYGAVGMELNQQVTGLTPGAFYELTGMINITFLDSRNMACSGFQINANANHYDGLIYSDIISSPTDGYQPFSVTFVAPTDGEMWVNAMWFGVNAGEAYLDSMKLDAVPAPASAALLSAALLAARRRRVA